MKTSTTLCMSLLAVRLLGALAAPAGSHSHDADNQETDMTKALFTALAAAALLLALPAGAQQSTNVAFAKAPARRR